MTLDEVIKLEEEAAEMHQKVVDTGIIAEKHLADYQRYAEEHRQLAEWLKELKQLREKESKDELKDLSKRVENIERQLKEDKEEQLKKLKAEIEYAKFRCALPTIQRMMGGEE